ncbi:esterase/lipase/thioesterase domain-containing protein [Basidiobolus meristosporus CBS 931.73]|uniref:Esterase/lipase/thioesterase domain-containing protein n=1 Tax=Basidiobolus meristosporus CBS 931.73 TaxID=1314790 RepID=A0A1Y1YLZ6_9FUNG|nr:esterase/lipase/thioesterase domain-containing protein [Basidiobolus meristosporus CBS 931.73]|eukprot:ORX99039.1 esterase/lipase/thioesterase domain-containing protein [Basidiobolus meristosporus CBS 931.73]
MTSPVNIVLVHGAWADGSSWSHVIPTLLQSGHKVVSAQLPLTSLADDVDRLRKLLDSIQGPTILVGHSYGCAVITGAGTGVSHVIGLVFIAGFALDEGESLADVFSKYPALESGQHIKPDSHGFLWVEPKYYHQDFAADVSPDKAAVMAAVQNPIAGQGFTDKSGPPAWKSLPSWYQVSENDMMIPPEAERMMAKRANSTTISLPASHASLVSHGKEVADFILQAAKDCPRK